MVATHTSVCGLARNVVRFCSILLDEQHQEERMARADIASAVQDTNAIDFDLPRSMVSRTSEDLPV